MFRLPSIILRIAVGTALGVVFFIFSARFLGAGGAASTAVTILAVALPILAGLLAAWGLLDLWSYLIWRRLERVTSAAESDLPEYEWERTIKRGLRRILGPLTPPWSIESRTRVFVQNWTDILLAARLREPWCWRFYGLAIKELTADPERLARLSGLLFETDPLPEDAFLIGLEMFRQLPDRSEVSRKLALESLSEAKETWKAGGREILEEVWTAAYFSQPDLRQLLLPRLVERFLDAQRRDIVAGQIYLDAYNAGLRNFGLTREMAVIASILEQNRREPELAKSLRDIVGSGDDGPARQSEEPGISFETRDDYSGGEGTEADSAVQAVDGAGGAAWGREPEQVAEEPEDEERGSVSGSKPGKPEEKTATDTPGRVSPPGGGVFATYGKRGKSRTGVVAGIIVIAVIFAVVAGLFIFHRQGGSSVGSNGLTPPGLVVSEEPYTVQVVAYKTEKAAARQVNFLRQKGVDAYIVEPRDGGSRYYRVRFGHFSSTKAASKAADSLKAAGVISEFFITRFDPGVVPGK